MVIQHKSYPVSPPWLRPLITAKFFDPCSNHTSSQGGEASTSRIECNLFCLDCMTQPLCFGCTFTHKNHHIVQIRRSSYHDVIRVSEIQKVLDLSGVQSYIINSARVVFLNGRPQTKLAKGVTKTCEVCERSLNESFRYCSLGCKLQGIDKHNELTFILPQKPQVSNVHHRVYPEDLSTKRTRYSKRASAVKHRHDADAEHLQNTDVQGNAGSTEETVDKVESSASHEGSSSDNKPDVDAPVRADAAKGDFETSRDVGRGDECEVRGAEENLVEISPSTPPQSMNSVCHQRAAKRRKGTPHRSHLGGVTMGQDK